MARPTPTVSRNCCTGHREAIDLAKKGSGPGPSAPERRSMRGRVPSVSHLEHPSNRLLRRRLCGSAVQHTRPRGTVVDAALSATTCVGSRCRRSEYTSKRPERGLSAQRTRRRVTKQKPSARHKKWRTAGSPSPRCSSPRPKRSTGPSSGPARTRGFVGCTGGRPCRRHLTKSTRPASPWSTAPYGLK